MLWAILALDLVVRKQSQRAVDVTDYGSISTKL